VALTLHATSTLNNSDGPKNDLDPLTYQILRTVNDCRFVSTEDLHLLFGGEKNTMQVRLTRLTKQGYLARPEAQKDLDRERGRPMLIYSLGREGARTLGVKFENPDMKKVSLRHALMVTRVYLTLLIGALRPAPLSPPLSIDYWVREPDSLPWLAIPENKGKKDRRTPDAVVECRTIVESRTPPEKQDRFFIECETGNEPRERTNLSSQSSFLRKIYYYQQLYKLTSKQFPAFRVLTILPDDDDGGKYLNHLRRLCREADPQEKGLGIFWFTLESNVRPHDPAAFLHEPAWTVPQDEKLHTLL
jgi:hypothetical protein